MNALRDPEALRRRGVEQLSLGRLAEALDSLLEAVHLAPDDPAINFAFATLAIRLQQPALAVGHLQRVRKVLPDSDAACAALARAHAALGHAEEGLALLEALLRRQPASRLARLTCGILREQTTDFAGAAADYESVLHVAPNDPTLRHHRAFLRLRDGDFGAGFADYEQRFDGGDVARPPLAGPHWDGSAVGALQIVAEQGLGDVLHFARFAASAPALLHGRAGKITLAVPPPLAGLLRRSVPVEVIELEVNPDRGAGAARDAGEQRRFDAAIELMSLPHVLALGSDCIATPAAYLQTDPARAALAARLPARSSTQGGALRVGVAWAASTAHPTEASPYCRRSCPQSALARLFARADCRFVSLQVGPRAKDVARFPQVVDAAPWIGDFDDTAALVAALDLVVTVDTSIAHLAGSLGRPVLLMLPFSANWQWMHGDRTPWYPTAKLFRQKRVGDWDGVVDDVGREIEAMGSGLARPDPFISL
jgi:tetratricopeptide (TPR) repeat protein